MKYKYEMGPVLFHVQVCYFLKCDTELKFCICIWVSYDCQQRMKTSNLRFPLGTINLTFIFFLHAFSICPIIHSKNFIVNSRIFHYPFLFFYIFSHFPRLQTFHNLNYFNEIFIIFAMFISFRCRQIFDSNW